MSKEKITTQHMDTVNEYPPIETSDETPKVSLLHGQYSLEFHVPAGRSQGCHSYVELSAHFDSYGEAEHEQFEKAINYAMAFSHAKTGKITSSHFADGVKIVVSRFKGKLSFSGVNSDGDTIVYGSGLRAIQKNMQ